MCFKQQRESFIMMSWKKVSVTLDLSECVEKMESTQHVQQTPVLQSVIYSVSYIWSMCTAEACGV